MDVLSWKDVALYVVTPLLTLICGLVAFIVHAGMNHIDSHIHEDRRNFEKLFVEQKAVIEKMGSGFTELYRMIDQRHICLLNKLTEHIQNGNKS